MDPTAFRRHIGTAEHEYELPERLDKEERYEVASRALEAFADDRPLAAVDRDVEDRYVELRGSRLDPRNWPSMLLDRPANYRKLEVEVEEADDTLTVTEYHTEPMPAFRTTPHFYPYDEELDELGEAVEAAYEDVAGGGM